ncbi:hypothetical protein [Streptomyces sp. CC224B]|uniref:hypothetical protein n=1 Tax=Streptomyces sp. CC224B TaxID=3044571 RepID=UPI0024A9402A|nr:hypothetical protein [Streptomyces sp. CC224B]
MNELTPEQERDNALAELARVRAALSVGLSVEQSARLQGSTPEELEADAQTLAAEFGLTSPPAPVHRSGGDRGPDIGNGAGTVAGGAERYRTKHPQRETRADEQQRRTNPFHERTYTVENR